MNIRITLLAAVAFLAVAGPAAASSLDQVSRQQERVRCSSPLDCFSGFSSPVLVCSLNGFCEDPLGGTNIEESLAANPEAVTAPLESPLKASAGEKCTSIRECEPSLVCVSGNPTGRCHKLDGIIGLSYLLVNLMQEDYTPGIEDDPTAVPTPSQEGPTATSRALAIIYLAAHDTYGILTGAFSPKIRNIRLRRGVNRLDPTVIDLSSSAFEKQAVIAMQVAGLRAAKLLYPGSEERIDAIRESVTSGANPLFTAFGDLIGRAWIRVRSRDGAPMNQLDNIFFEGILRHQPDPNFPLFNDADKQQPNFGREWGRVRPFVLSSVKRDAFLGPFPKINSAEYRANLAEVMKKGQCNDLTSNGRPLKDIGIFWGYDGARQIGVPPRLYLQVALAVPEVKRLPLKKQIRLLTAVGVSMADAGIAAWFWKFEYDLWRPIIGIRKDPQSPNPDWNPIGVALSNSVVLGDAQPMQRCRGLNPDFPAYPSGHAAFGTAAFRTVAKMLSKNPRQISLRFTSDEFNGKTIDAITGSRRPSWTQRITLEDAIEQNKDGRVVIGVHWTFDSDGGDIVGTKVANSVANAFRF